MKKFFADHDIPRKLLAVLLAIALWAVVITNTSTLRTETYHNIPANFLGAEQLEKEYGLKIIEGADQKFSIRISAPFNTMNDFSNTGIDKASVSVNLSALDITEPGTYTIQTRYDCQLNLKNARISEEAKEITYPSSFQIIVDRIASKEVPVSVRVEGSAPENYIYNDAEVEQESVVVTGPETVVSQIRKAVAIVPATESGGLTKTTNLLVSFTYFNEAGEVVDATYLSSAPSEASVQIPVFQVAKVPLTVDLVSSPNLSKDEVDVKIEPTEISVYGDSEIISKLKQINLGKIVLGAVDLTEPKIMPIPTIAGVTPLTGEPATAKVTLKAVGMSTREISVSHIEMQNTGADQSLHARVQTPSLTVRLQAESSVLDALTASDITVRAIFNADELGPGEHEVPVEIQPYGIAHFTVLNSDPTVTVVITQQQLESSPDAQSGQNGSDGSTAEDEPTT